MTIPLRCVVDASVGIKQFIPDAPLMAKVDQLFAHLANPKTAIFVPDLFYIKCGNIIWKYVRARLYAVADVQADLATLKSFPLRVVSTADLMADAVTIALNYGISAYDASYVALSQQVAATLLTLNAKLNESFKRFVLQCLLV
ncbi:type II toxin-antitoxin system VapC family toxin [Komarekiella delphini-convector]|uniref:type II toxin-antitoxin system VapC family toxin n=1 Tax=Komarekiella delphini-convector TaxID=3050158 RepID=UPI001CD87EEA|nr:type II toxin-antitoxin system VapC family toxin [Komarekiella delphini-convector]